jgi:prepilin-type N-terminal cleavage/methylation domain-containing protein
MTTSRTEPRGGFTMVELLITISIITLLFSVLAMSGGGLKQKARIENTKSMISQLELYLDTYKSKSGAYPPDGLDGKKIYTEEGTQLMSGAALSWALTRPIDQMKRQPDGTMKAIGTTSPVAEFKQGELVDHAALGADLFDPEALEVCDAWGWPIHYDRLGGGRESYSRQDTSEVHLGWEDIGYEDVDDPRTFEGISVELVGPQNLGEFDIWSHGPSGHILKDLDPEEHAAQVVANWDLPLEGAGRED